MRLGVFIGLPLIGYLLFTQFAPLNVFTFRAWESLLPISAVFRGPFYPNQTLEMIEIGDLGKGTSYAVSKPMIFITDEYGFRNRPQQAKQYDIVIVGNSMTGGVSLTQADTLAEVLADRTNRTVYNYAPASLAQFLAEKRFQDSPPNTIVFQVLERGMLGDFCSEDDLFPVTTASVETNPAISYLAVDLWIRNYFYLLAYVKANFKPLNNPLIANEYGMLFLDLSLESEDLPSIDLEAEMEALQVCRQWVMDRGMDFIFLPIPDKENVYFDQIPDAHRPFISTEERREFYNRVVNIARTNDITTVDLLDAFLDARAEGKITFQLDDTHWNPTGVSIAVDQIIPLLTR